MSQYELQKKKVSELEKQLAEEKRKLETIETCITLGINKGDYCLVNEYTVIRVCKVSGDTIYGESYDKDCGYDEDDYYNVKVNNLNKITKQEAIDIINIWHNKILDDMGLS